MNRWIVPFLVLVGCLVFSGCIEESTVIKVNRDGSGVIHERSYSASADGVSFFPSLSGGKKDEADAAEQEVELPSEAELREYASTLGAGVTFTSVKPSTNKKGWNGYEVIFEFNDINTVRYARNTPKPKSEDDAQRSDEKPEEVKEDFKVAFAMKDGALSIKMEKEGFQKPKQEPVQASDSPTIDPYADTSGAAEVSVTPQAMNENMLKAMTKGMRMGVFVQIDGEIAETNATHRNGKLITLFNADLGTLLENEGGMAAMNQIDKLDRVELQVLADELDGLDIDLQDPITVEFK